LVYGGGTGIRACLGRWNGRFATGTDGGVRPYTGAWLRPFGSAQGRHRWTGEGARPHTSRAACVRSYSLVRLRLRCTGLRFAGQDSAAFFDALPEVGIGGLPPAADIVRDAMLQH